MANGYFKRLWEPRFYVQERRCSTRSKLLAYLQGICLVPFLASPCSREVFWKANRVGKETRKRSNGSRGAVMVCRQCRKNMYKCREVPHVAASENS